MTVVLGCLLYLAIGLIVGRISCQLLGITRRRRGTDDLLGVGSMILLWPLMVLLGIGVGAVLLVIPKDKETRR